MAGEGIAAFAGRASGQFCREGGCVGAGSAQGSRIEGDGTWL